MLSQIGDRALLLKARIRVSDISELEWPSFEGVKRGMRPSIFKSGFHYATTVHASEGVIAPGGTGDITLLTASDALTETDLRAGSKLELRGGPKLLAVGFVLEICQVSVARSSSHPNGYEVRLLTE